MRKNIRFLECDYRITVSLDLNNILVENLSDPYSIIFNIYDYQIPDSIKEAFNKKDWEKFLHDLIADGRLN